VVAFDPWSLAIAVVIYIVMSMSSCNEDEGKLAMKEGAGLCHTIGTWCSSCIRIFGKCVACIEHTTGKCCFNSKLARIVNEQGRVQVGKGWGSGKNPDCSGFTIAQLQSLDFRGDGPLGVLCLHRPDAAQCRNDPGQQRLAPHHLLLRTGEMPMKPVYAVALLAAFALPVFADDVLRTPVPDARPLMLAALQATDGQAHGVLTGEMADAITRRFGATSPIFIDVTTEKRYAQPGCSRLKVTFWQDGVLLPGATTPRRQTMDFGINYCLDGRPPQSLK
jgi:hypothetical protein